MRKGMLLVLLVLFALSGAALAQNDQPMFCGDLSGDDCALLQGAQTAMESVDAAAFDLFIDVQVEAEGENMPLSIVGSGSYTGRLAAANMDVSGGTDAALAGLRNFNAALMLTFTLPQADASTPNMLTLDLRLVDGVGYVNFDELQALLNDPSFTGWGGLDIAGMLGALLEENPEIFSQLGQMSGMDADALSQFDPQAAEQYMTVTRTDDGSGTSATFEIALDLAGLTSDPAFADMMGQMGGMSGMGSGDQEEMQQVFENSTFIVREVINTISGQMESIAFELDIDASQTTSNGDSMAGGMVSVTGMINFNYENVPMVETPADASILPYQQLLGMFGGMMGGMSGENRPAPQQPTTVAPTMPTPTASG